MQYNINWDNYILNNQTVFNPSAFTYIWLDVKTNTFYVMVLPGYGMSQYNPFTSLYSAMNEQRNIEAHIWD